MTPRLTSSAVRRTLRRLYGPLVSVQCRDGVWHIGVRQGAQWQGLASDVDLAKATDAAVALANGALGYAAPPNDDKPPRVTDNTPPPSTSTAPTS